MTVEFFSSYLNCKKNTRYLEQFQLFHVQHKTVVFSNLHIKLTLIFMNYQVAK